jgi:hypothetical protein
MNVTRFQMIGAAIEAGYNVTRRAKLPKKTDPKSGANQSSSQPASSVKSFEKKHLSKRQAVMGVEKLVDLERLDMMGDWVLDASAKLLPAWELNAAGELVPSTVEAVDMSLGAPEVVYFESFLAEEYALDELFIVGVGPELVGYSFAGPIAGSVGTEAGIVAADAVMGGTLAASIGDAAVAVEVGAEAAAVASTGGPPGWVVAGGVILVTAAIAVGEILHEVLSHHGGHGHSGGGGPPMHDCGPNEHLMCNFVNGTPGPTGHMVPLTQPDPTPTSTTTKTFPPLLSILLGKVTSSTSTELGPVTITDSAANTVSTATKTDPSATDTDSATKTESATRTNSAERTNSLEKTDSTMKTVSATKADSAEKTDSATKTDSAPKTVSAA